MNKENTNLYTLYKMDISYFSGKMEAYLRYKDIPYNAIECCDDMKAFHRVGIKTGFQKVPAIEMANGQWLFDTTPMIQWLDLKHPEPSVFPDDPALRFVSLLLEDYGDEWLWRPAMWWRWVPKSSRVTLGRRISKILSKRFAIPLGLYFGWRQLNEWLWKDGVDKHNSDDVRDMLFRELEFLEPLFEDQTFILGSHPSIADFGYFASFFRHFGNDPISAEVMRRQGPNAYEWLARLWNAKQSKLPDRIEFQWPSADYWQPLLERIAKDYLPYLHQNALAFKAGQKRFDYQGHTLAFKQTVTTSYRVWCRQELQREFSSLNEADQKKVESLFASVGGLEILHRDGVIESGMTEQFQLPIDPIEVKQKPSIITRYMGQPRN
jgi:glutathione S-transferase